MSDLQGLFIWLGCVGARVSVSVSGSGSGSGSASASASASVGASASASADVSAVLSPTAGTANLIVEHVVPVLTLALVWSNVSPAQNGESRLKKSRLSTTVAGARYAQRCPVEFGVDLEVVIAA
jgi:hypothetical protein